MSDYEINDKRLQKEFAGYSFSQFKKSDVKKQLIKSIQDGKVETANYWCVELICAGHFLEVWETIILIMGKHIHYGNPKLPIYIEMRIQNFKDIVGNGYIDREIHMRNNAKIRQIFSEIISILCFSQKKHSYDSIKIKKTDYDITEINFRLKADHIHYSQDVYKKDDPKELFIAYNEFLFCLHKDSKNMANACYWMEWISEYESLCKKQKEVCQCQRRDFVPVDPKKQMDIIWMIWDAILFESTRRNKVISKIIRSLLGIFCIRYTTAVKKRRKYIIYFAIALLTETIDLSIPIHKNTELLENIKGNIHKIYGQVKKNEVKPDTDYLFNGVNQSSIEKSIAKIEMMNNVGFVPRK